MTAIGGMEKQAKTAHHVYPHMSTVHSVSVRLCCENSSPRSNRRQLVHPTRKSGSLRPRRCRTWRWSVGRSAGTPDQSLAPPSPPPEVPTQPPATAETSQRNPRSISTIIFRRYSAIGYRRSPAGSYRLRDTTDRCLFETDTSTVPRVLHMTVTPACILNSVNK